ncbi:hypothetical protein [Actinomadura geliboluensis]|uniref:hypothetical protein n=1 Tax=Actinomadura geliboluensis TaxID=882440 RepID=UPI0036A47363
MAEPEPDQPDGFPAPGIERTGRFEWERVIRRCRLGFYEGRTKDPKRWVRHAAVQQVALVLATYADLDGTRVRPSIVLLARVCDLDERTVRVCVTRLRRLNLLEQVRPPRSPGRAGGPGSPAEYRLTTPSDLLDRVAHLDPDGTHVVVPDGVDLPPLRRPRKKTDAGSADDGLWTAPPTPGPDPVDDQ